LQDAVKAAAVISRAIRPLNTAAKVLVERGVGFLLAIIRTYGKRVSSRDRHAPKRQPPPGEPGGG